MTDKQTEVSIHGDAFHLNGRPTYAGRIWRGCKIEGLLFNSRMVQGIFDDQWEYQPNGNAVVVEEVTRKVTRETSAVMHQRMGFYVAPSGRLLVLGFYGVCPTPMDQPNDGNGIGRVAREVSADGSLGPIYFIRYNEHAGWNAENTRYPLFTESADEGFVQACEDLLADRLKTLQWWEEDRDPNFFPAAIQGCKALSYYHLLDGRVAGLWKFSKVSISDDEGQHWEQVCESPSLVMEGGKVWGQKTADGRYALVYTPIKRGRHPLSIVTSDNGLVFDDLVAVNPDTSHQRYIGLHKGFGQQYVRGLAEGNGTPPEDYLWITYSMNKEDIWISRIPLPIRSREEKEVDDDFKLFPPGAIVENWNITSLKWSEVSVDSVPGTQETCLKIAARDPRDYAKAERVFPESKQVTIECSVMIGRPSPSRLIIEVASGEGASPFTVALHGNGEIAHSRDGQWVSIATVFTGEWTILRFDIDVEKREWDLSANGEECLSDEPFSHQVAAVERISFRTGEMWQVDTEPRQKADPSTGEWEVYGDDLPNSDQPLETGEFYIGWMRTKSF